LINLHDLSGEVCMNKSKLFIILGLIFLLIALILYFNTTNYVYNPTGPHSIALSDLYVRQLFFRYYIALIGAFLLILGIRDYKKQ
jgi:hypothetical protein